MLALITWLGFRQESRRIRQAAARERASPAGRCARKIKLVVDSITAFSDAPIQACWLGGAALMTLGGLMVLVGLVMFESLQAAVVVLLGAMAGGVPDSSCAPSRCSASTCGAGSISRGAGRSI